MEPRGDHHSLWFRIRDALNCSVFRCFRLTFARCNVCSQHVCPDHMWYASTTCDRVRYRARPVLFRGEQQSSFSAVLLSRPAACNLLQTTRNTLNVLLHSRVKYYSRTTLKTKSSTAASFRLFALIGEGVTTDDAKSAARRTSACSTSARAGTAVRPRVDINGTAAAVLRRSFTTTEVRFVTRIRRSRTLQSPLEATQGSLLAEWKVRLHKAKTLTWTSKTSFCCDNGLRALKCLVNFTSRHEIGD